MPLRLCIVFPLAGLAVLLSALPAWAQQTDWTTNGLPVCTAVGWQRNPRMVTDGDAGAIIVWEDLRAGSNPALYAARVTHEGTQPWDSNGVRLAAPQPGLRLAGMISDGKGGAWVGWWSRIRGNSDVYVQHLRADGTRAWADSGTLACGAAGDQQWAELAADGSGGVVLVWQDGRGTDLDVYAQRFGADGSTRWNANGVAVCDTAGEQSYPVLTVDRSGCAFVAWMDRRTEDDIYAQYVTADGIVSWSDDLPVCKEIGRQIGPKILAFGDSNAVVFWQDYRLGPTTSALYLQEIHAAGRRVYFEDYQVSSSPTAQTGMFLAPDGRKGAMAVWSDYRSSGDANIYMRTILADGTVIGDFGNALCVAPDAQERPQIITDGFGGGFGVWQDKRNTFDYDIYMNRVSSRGMTDYTAWKHTEGLLLASADNNQLAPQVIPSGQGAAIVCWYDGRTLDGQADIYAQRVRWASWIQHPDSIRFAMTRMVDTATVDFTVRNSGAVPLTIANIRRASDPATTHPRDFLVLAPTKFPLVLAPGDSIAVTVAFMPTDVGERVSAARVISDAPEETVIIPLRGVGTNPKIDVLPFYSFNAGKVGGGKNDVIPAAVRNTGNGLLLITNIEITGANSDEFLLRDLPPFPIAIEAGSAFDLPMRFAPKQEGAREARVLVSSNASGTPREIRVSGKGEYPALITIPSTLLRFDTTMTTRTRTLPLQIRNVSNVELLVSGIDIDGTDAAEFGVTAMLPLAIASGGTADVPVSFTPVTVGAKRARLIVRSDDPASPDTVRLDGPAILLGADRPGLPGSPRISALYPNPVRPSPGQSVIVEFTARAGADARIEVVDLLGRVRYGRALADPMAGMMRLPVGDLPPGIYAVRLIAAGTPVATRRLVLLR